MSFLARIAARAAPMTQTAPVLVPKQRGIRRAPAIARAAPPEDEEPIKRAEVAEEPEVERRFAAPLRRQTAAEGEPEGERPAEGDTEPEARRQEEDEPEARRAPPQNEEPEVPLPEAEGEEPVARQAGDEEPEARRAESEDRPDEPPPAGKEEELMASRAVAPRAPGADRPLLTARAPTAEEMAPEKAKLPDEVAGEPEPPDLRALRRAPPAPAPAAPSGIGAEALPPAAGPASGQTEPAAVEFPDQGIGYDDFSLPETEFDSRSTGFSRPQVVIEQLDVLIHEPAPTGPSRRPHFDAARTLRARYLRRL